MSQNSESQDSSRHHRVPKSHKPNRHENDSEVVHNEEKNIEQESEEQKLRRLAIEHVTASKLCVLNDLVKHEVKLFGKMQKSLWFLGEYCTQKEIDRLTSLVKRYQDVRGSATRVHDWCNSGLLETFHIDYPEVRA